MLEEKDKEEKLRDLAHKKVELMNVNELHDFVMNYASSIKEVCNTVPTYDDLRTCMDFRIMAYNNAHLGRKDFGGEKYKRCLITIFNQELSPREMLFKLQWFVPSGYGDGSSKHESGQIDYTYILTDEDIVSMKRNGARYHFKNIFKIKEILDHKDDFPFTMIDNNHGGI